jgi:hypothetical protein
VPRCLADAGNGRLIIFTGRAGVWCRRAEGTGRCCMGRRPGPSRPARGGRTLVPPVR